jgi:integrase
MATLYKKRGWWFIEYKLGEQRKTKNTKLAAIEANKPKAEKLKKDIEEITKAREDSIKAEDVVIGEITLNTAIDMFEKIYMIGRSEKHKEIFDYVMVRFKEIVPGKTCVKSINIEHISQFTAQMKRDLSQATQVTYFQYLASLLGFLKENKYIDYVPIGKGVRPKKAIKNIISFDPVDLKKILDEAKKRDIMYYHAFMMFLLTGQRPGDVLRLQIRDIDFHRKIIYFRVSKTASEFKFPIYLKLEEFMKGEMHVDDREKDEYLFGDFTVNGAGKAFRKIKKALGFHKRQYYTLKTFRKSFATEMSKMGMTIQEVQVLLDHKSPSTTLRYYADVRAEQLKNKIDKLQTEIY